MKNINPKYVKLLQKSYEKYQHIDTVTTDNVVQEVGSADIKIDLDNQNSKNPSKLKLNSMTVIKSVKEKCENPVKQKMESSKAKKSQVQNRFTPSEDKVLLEAIESGKELNNTKLAKMMKRDIASIRNRIAKLIRSKSSSKSQKYFTLEEDLILIEHAVSKMGGGILLRNVNRSKLDFPELSQSFGRDIDSVYRHWVGKLMVWLLSHYNKSLNLDIRPMLANYVAEHFTDVDNIQWDKILTYPEFAGHTETSIGILYKGTMVRHAEMRLGVHRKHLTLRQIADTTEELCKNSSVSEKLRRRQMEVINHFEKLVSERKIKNFI